VVLTQVQSSLQLRKLEPSLQPFPRRNPNSSFLTIPLISYISFPGPAGACKGTAGLTGSASDEMTTSSDGLLVGEWDCHHVEGDWYCRCLGDGKPTVRVTTTTYI